MIPIFLDCWNLGFHKDNLEIVRKITCCFFFKRVSYIFLLISFANCVFAPRLKLNDFFFDVPKIRSSIGCLYREGTFFKHPLVL